MQVKGITKKGLRLILKEQFDDRFGDREYGDFFEFKRDIEDFLEEFKELIQKLYGEDIMTNYYLHITKEVATLSLFFTLERDTDGLIIHPQISFNRIKIPRL